MNKGIWIIMVFVAGSFLPIQAGLNARLSKSIQNPIYASLVSFVVGTVALALYILFSKQQLSVPGFKSAPGYVYIAGALGAFYIAAVILAFPRIGPALTFSLLVAGQMIISVLLAHFNILVTHQRSINFWHVLGVVLIIMGVVIIRKY